MKQSLIWRFNLSAIAIITVILVSFGVYDYQSESAELNKRMDADLAILSDSLNETIPPSLWNFESEQVNLTLASAIKNSAIVGVMVLDGDKVLSGFVRSPDGEVTEANDASALKGQVQETQLSYEEGGTVYEVGRVLLAKNVAEIEMQQQRAVRQAIFQIVILDLLVAISLSTLVQRLVKTPLKEISDALEDISSGDGDLTQRLRIQRKDEIGLVARFFNVFVEKIQHSMQLVDDSAREVTKAVDTVTQNAEENLNAVKQVHQDTDQVATAINEMNSTAHEVANNAQQVSQSAQHANQETLNAQGIVNQTSESIAELSSEIIEGTGVMSSLKGDVNGIVGVLETIRGIAEQTNLLALNAAIEAARAGDQGRGFAVVADEVRALAARTQESTGEIQAMIEKLEKGSEQAVSVMERSSEKSSKTVERVQHAIESLNNISNAISNINDMSTQIAAAVEEQTHVSEEINRNVLNIVNIIQSTADSANETAQTSSILSDHAESLSTLVGQFRLR
ncbi:methyl-accepting chemotaxis protein [Reinekea sp. G2M2-21]|uniref:methyl-accepting chemotaxis protein n=1 Tax=Reinekea sp. G2M2-21 TaxID=2788942 RepID=UPI0018A8A113|nr:methyl-accepting chemotaxis protein [Reinekea sp. G2M2-21]